MNICIVSSCGGHLTEVMELKSVYENYDHFYIINKKISMPNDINGRVSFITHSERDYKFFVNILEIYRIFKSNRPDVVISTGAGPAVPAALVARYLFRSKVIYIETIASIVKPSITGRLMYYLAHEFYYQWESLEFFFPKAKFIRGV